MAVSTILMPINKEIHSRKELYMKQWLEMREKYMHFGFFRSFRNFDCVNFEMLTSVISNAINLVGYMYHIIFVYLDI